MIAQASQYFADLLHLLYFVVLIRQILLNKSVHGSLQLIPEISYRTQEMFLVVCFFRYADILWDWHSDYLTFMKLLFTVLTLFTVFLVRFQKPYCLVDPSNAGLRSESR